MAQTQIAPHLQTQALCTCVTVKAWVPTSLEPKSNKAGLGVAPAPSPKAHTSRQRVCPGTGNGGTVQQAGGMPGSKQRGGRQGDAGNRGGQGRSNATSGRSRGYLGCSPSPWSGRLDPASSHSPRWVLGAARWRRRRRVPAGERVRGGAAGAAGEGGKAHPVGTRGRTAAAWRSSPGCPSWSPRPGTLFEPEGVPRTEGPAAAASSGRRLSQAV